MKFTARVRFPSKSFIRSIFFRNEGTASGCEGIRLKPEAPGRWSDILKVLRASSARVIRSPAEIISTGTNLIIPFPWVLFTRALLFHPSLDYISIKAYTWGSVLRHRLNGLLLFDLGSRCFKDVSKSDELDAARIRAHFCLSGSLAGTEWWPYWWFTYPSLPFRMKLVPILSTETPHTLGQFWTTWGMASWCWTRTWQKKVASLSQRLPVSLECICFMHSSAVDAWSGWRDGFIFTF